MLGRGKPKRGRGTRVRFAVSGGRRVVTVEGGDLPEVERRRLQRLLRPLRLASGTVVVRRDFAGRRRVAFSRDIPEPLQQTIRNILGNLSRLGAP
jgi:Ribonuclease G/E